MKRVIVPGYKGSPIGHWQYELWKSDPKSILIEQRDFDNPEKNEWVAALQNVIEKIDEPFQLVGHSMGCITILFWTLQHNTPFLDSIVLVAPADSESDYLPNEIVGFSPMPTTVLPAKTTVVGSRNDPYMSYGRVLEFAATWGAEFIDAGFAGHINIESGYGDWPELTVLLTRCEKEYELLVKCA